MAENEERLLEASEAAQYLSDKWGIPYTTDALKMLRSRSKGKYKPTMSGKNATYWSKSDLDKIPKPQRGRKAASTGVEPTQTPGDDSAPDRWYSPLAELATA